jgi:hypothetical protein
VAVLDEGRENGYSMRHCGEAGTELTQFSAHQKFAFGPPASVTTVVETALPARSVAVPDGVQVNVAVPTPEFKLPQFAVHVPIVMTTAPGETRVIVAESVVAPPCTQVRDPSRTVPRFTTFTVRRSPVPPPLTEPSTPSPLIEF